MRIQIQIFSEQNCTVKIGKWVLIFNVPCMQIWRSFSRLYITIISIDNVNVQWSFPINYFSILILTNAAKITCQQKLNKFKNMIFFKTNMKIQNVLRRTKNVKTTFL